MGTKILYYLIIKPLSLLPYWFLYLISDFLYFFFRYIFTYRKAVVVTNIKNSFPSNSNDEQLEIMYGFYRHLCDLIVEGVKLFSISKRQIDKRFKITNPALIDMYFDNGKDVILVGGHYNNWEMLAAGIHQKLKHDYVGIYAPLNNKFFNDKFLQSRGKFGLKMLPKKETTMFFKKEKAIPVCIIFGADQSPTYSKNVIWTQFLNQDTAVAVGVEILAKKHDCPVLFGAINKVKRGYYTLEFQLITDKPKSTNPEWITNKHVRLLEKQIISKPSYWLWSHKRWKRKR